MEQKGKLLLSWVNKPRAVEEATKTVHTDFWGITWIWLSGSSARINNRVQKEE